jgi:hypothetical protein
MQRTWRHWVMRFFESTEPCRTDRRLRPRAIGLEKLEDRTLLTVIAWSNYGQNPQHTALSNVPSQPLQTIAWQTPVDLDPQYTDGGDLLIHYGSPVVTEANTVIIPVKVGATDGFQVEAQSGVDGSLLWTAPTDYRLPPHGWTPSYSPVLTSANRLYFPGAGGTLYYIDNPDDPGATISGQVAFYGIENYTHSLDSRVFINTPLTPDDAGDIFFGFQVTGSNSLHLTSGIARMGGDGTGTWVAAGAAAGDSGIDKAATGSAPALSNDQSLLYVAVNRTSTGRGDLLALDSTTLATVAEVALRDPKNGADAGVSDNSTASPTVGPDGEVYFGVVSARGVVTHSRGWLLQFDAYLNESQPPGAFGWDDTVSIVPSSMVRSYQGPSDYLLMTKYNNYAGNSGGDGVNKIAILDPNVSMFDDIDQTDVMNEVLTIAGVTPDPNFPDYPGAVREWCINNAAVDPFTNSILANSEDGSLYRWDLSTNTFTESMALTDATGEAYTPTIIGVDGTVYAINNATLFALQAVPTYNGQHGFSLSDANLIATEIQSIGIALFGSADIDSFHALHLNADLKNGTAGAALTGLFDNLVRASGSRHKPGSPALLQDASQSTTTGSRLGTTNVLPFPDDLFLDLFGSLSLGDPIHTRSK